MRDQYGRKIDYLRVSLTDRCNLRCIYCMPEDGIEKLRHEDILRFEEVMQIIKAFAKIGGRKIRFTGGEPLILKGITELITKTSQVPGIEDIALTTNGILLADMADDLKKAGLKRVNISLDSLKQEKFKQITRGGNVKNVLAAIEKCLMLGISPVKLNVVLIKGVNDDEIQDFVNLTVNLPLHVRFIELMPLGEGAKYYHSGYMNSNEIMMRIPGLVPLEDDMRSTAKMYKLKNAKGNIGFITPMSCKFCISCNRIRLTSVGTIKPCLHSEAEISIKEYIDNEAFLVAALKNAILGKPREHHLEGGNASKSLKMMYQIGG